MAYTILNTKPLTGSDLDILAKKIEDVDDNMADYRYAYKDHENWEKIICAFVGDQLLVSGTMEEVASYINDYFDRYDEDEDEDQD